MNRKSKSSGTISKKVMQRPYRIQTPHFNATLTKRGAAWLIGSALVPILGILGKMLKWVFL